MITRLPRIKSISGANQISGAVFQCDADTGVTTDTGVTLKSMTPATASSYIGAATSAFSPGTGDFTVGFSLYLDTIAPGHNQTICKGGNIGSQSDFIWINVLNTSGLLSVYLGDGVTTSFSAWQALPLVAKQWYTIIIKFDRDVGYTIILDNVTSTSVNALPNFQGACSFNDFSIGGYTTNTSLLNGRLDGFFFLPRLTTTDEDNWLFNGGKWRVFSECGVAGTFGENLNSSTLTAWFDFENSGAIGTDSTTNDNDLSVTGTVNQADGTVDKSTVVTQWNDNIGGNHLVQSNAIESPVLVKNAIAGHNALTFFGDSMEKSFTTSINAPYTIFAVVKSSGTNSVYFDNTSVDNVKIGNNSNGRFFGSAGGEVYNIRKDTLWHVHCLQVNGATTIYSVDGIERKGSSGSSALNGVFLGSDFSKVNKLNGQIAEVVVYNRALDYSERRAVNTYLGRKYKIKIGKMLAYANGSGKVFVRVPWSATHDYVSGMTVNYPRVYYSGATDYTDNYPTFANDPIGGLVPATQADSVTTMSTTMHSSGDDITPCFIGDSYYMGNHGYASAIHATVSSHDKDETDVGSIWADANSKQFTLIAVNYNNDATHLTFLGDNSAGSDSNWNYNTTRTGNLTHVSGATHTAGITVSSSTIAQIIPSSRHELIQYYVDGKLFTSKGVGAFVCDSFEVRHDTYGIHVPSLVEYLQTNVGNLSGTKTDFNSASIETALKREISYSFYPNGSVFIDEDFTFLKDIKLEFHGFIQAGALTIPSSGTIHYYIPDTKPFSIGANNYDLTNLHNITSLSEDLKITKEKWLSLTKAPNRFMEVTKTSSGSNHFGLMLGYHPSRGIGANGTREAYCDDTTRGAAWIYNVSKKNYPLMINSSSTNVPTGIITAGSTYNCKAYRLPMNYNEYSNTCTGYWKDDLGNVYVNLDFHSAYDPNFDGKILLPTEFTGMNITVVESFGNVYLNSTVVPEDGISVAVGSKGSCILQLTD